MYFKKTLFIATCVLALSICACNKEKKAADPALPATWTDGNVNYTFASNGTFGIRYNRLGNTQDKVETDSIWGEYTLDKKRSNIYWDAKYLTKKNNPGLILTQPTNLPVWNYAHTSDTTLTYTSNSISGKLRKLKK